MTTELLLRRAVAEMRHWAEAATPGPWETYSRPDHNSAEVGVGARNELGHVADVANWCAGHIASWHPAVALAVADWLDWTAGEASLSDHAPTCEACQPALSVARAYLGEHPADRTSVSA